MLATLQAGIGESEAAPPKQLAGRLWQPVEDRLEPEGTLSYAIPPYAAGEALQIQVRAKDRAGNYGLGYSKMILVTGFKSWPATQPATAPGS